MDALSDVLHSARFSGSVLFRARLSAPWAVAAPPFRDVLPMIFPWARHHRLVLFHIVERGACWIEQPDNDPLRLEAHTIGAISF